MHNLELGSIYLNTPEIYYNIRLAGQVLLNREHIMWATHPSRHMLNLLNMYIILCHWMKAESSSPLNSSLHSAASIYDGCFYMVRPTIFIMFLMRRGGYNMGSVRVSGDWSAHKGHFNYLRIIHWARVACDRWGLLKQRTFHTNHGPGARVVDCSAIRFQINSAQRWWTPWDVWPNCPLLRQGQCIHIGDESVNTYFIYMYKSWFLY